MIARNQSENRAADIWSKLAAPLPEGVISWRQDGRPIQRDGKYFARFVCYVEANTVRERLDTVCPGEWDLTLDLLPAITAGEDDDVTCSFKARLQILGVIREDVGTGKDYKQAATDAFKRAGVRFGIAHELYAYEQNWVQVDGEGRYAKPLEDPAVAYARRWGNAEQTAEGEQRGDPTGSPTPRRNGAPTESDRAPSGDGAAAALAKADAEVPSCPKCGGRCWDNRLTKRNPKAPDFKCRDRACDGVIWPPKRGQATAAVAAKESDEPAEYGEQPPPPDDSDLPF